MECRYFLPLVMFGPHVPYETTFRFVFFSSYFEHGSNLIVATIIWEQAEGNDKSRNRSVWLYD